MITPESTESKVYRSGIFTLIGRPNVGKSTLINSLLKKHISITSDKPQTTRKVTWGVITRRGIQILVKDTPGIHKPKTLFGRALNDLAEASISASDSVGLCFPANQKIGPGDRFIINKIKELAPRKQIAVITKIDCVKKHDLLLKLSEIANLKCDFDAIVPLSARECVQIDVLKDVLFEHCAVFSTGQFPESRDPPLRERIADLIREKALCLLEKELPYSLFVRVSEILEDKNRVFIHANLYVEKESQKAIVLGRGGKTIKQISTAARLAITPLFTQKVYLHLVVKVAKNWQKNNSFLKDIVNF